VKKRLLIIPARKNSKRIRNKNFKFFFGKPIIEYSIELAISSKIFTKIHVSSDSIKYKKRLSKFSNIEIDLKRPKKLSSDSVGLMDVFNYIVNRYRDKQIFFDEVWFLSSCSPLITKKDLISASKLFIKNKSNILLSTCRYSQPIERSFYQKNKSLIPINKKMLKKNTQDFKEIFYHTGNFSIFDKEIFYKKNVKRKYTGFHLPISRSVDIDNIEDWELAEKLFNQ